MRQRGRFPRELDVSEVSGRREVILRIWAAGLLYLHCQAISSIERWSLVVIKVGGATS